MQYILAGAESTAKRETPANFLAEIERSTNDRENLVVMRTPLTLVVLNRFPYNNGHLLVAPRREVAELAGLADAEHLEIQQTISQMIQQLTTIMRPDGFNVGLNLGRAAGAGLPQHLHWHIVPRWNGDTNFMTVTGDARVIIQSLDELWLQLRLAMGLPT